MPAKRNTTEPTTVALATTPATATPATATEPQPATTAATEPARPATAADNDHYEPYPGANFFHGGRTSPIIRAMGRRLVAEDCGHYPGTPGADWTEAHRRSFAAWQHKLRPGGDGDVSGIPDQQTWDQLRVPRITPRP